MIIKGGLESLGSRAVGLYYFSADWLVKLHWRQPQALRPQQNR